MTPQDFEKLEGLLVKANQSGKKETSGLVAEVMSRIKIEIEQNINEILPPIVKQVVNGKIDNIKEHLIKQDKHAKEQDAKLDSIMLEQGKVKIALNIAETITNPLLKARQFWGVLFGGIASLGGFVKWLSAIVLAVAAVLVLFKLIP